MRSVPAEGSGLRGNVTGPETTRDPEIQFAKSGDVHIAYQVVGDGPVDLVWIADWLWNLELQWEQPIVARFLERLASFSRLLLFDKRGSGLSDRTVDPDLFTLEVRIDDVRAVMDAARSEQAYVLGAGDDGASIAAVFGATVPERTPWRCCSGPARKASSPTTTRWGTTPVPPTSGPARRRPSGDRTPTVAGGSGASRRPSRTTRTSSGGTRGCSGRPRVRGPSPRSSGNRRARSARDAFGDPRSDPRAPPDRRPGYPSRGRARSGRADPRCPVRGAPWRRCPPVGGRSGRAAGRGRGLRDRLEAVRRRRRALATVLFTDIVGSTEKAAELGDAPWKDLLAEHDVVVRRALAGHRGTEIDRTGDGFLVTFDGPARAVRCARDIAEEVGRLGIEIRAGCHTGEIELVDGGIRGIAVHIAARVMALAGPSEVLVSSTVRDLVGGSGLSFEERGTHELKGVPGEWRLFAAVPM